MGWWGECDVGSRVCLWAVQTPLRQLKWNWHHGVKEFDEVHHKLLSHAGVKVRLRFHWY